MQAVPSITSVGVEQAFLSVIIWATTAMGWTARARRQHLQTCETNQRRLHFNIFQGDVVVGQV